MLPSQRVPTLLLTILLLTTTSFLSSAHPRPQTQKFGCGTSPTAENLAAISQVLSLPFAPSLQTHKRFQSFPSSTNLSSFSQLNIDTWIHIVAESKILEDGWIPEEQVDRQMVELNANFAPQNIRFTLKGVTRSINSYWANDEPGAELQMKRALRKGDYKTLNIYFQKSLVAGSFGYAHFPGEYEEGSDEFFLDGISNRYDTVPGGTLEEYNLGRTVTHETGHWLGLLHTFSGFDCDSPTGDLISDTPAQSWPTTGCPISSDTCPNEPGLDPIHNYMDYSTDTCYETFTPLQTKRMHDIYHTFRSPRACHADKCLRSLRASTIPGRLEESTEFCSEFTKVIVTDVAVVKGYLVKECGGKGSGVVVGRVSSACSCLPGATGVADGHE